MVIGIKFGKAAHTLLIKNRIGGLSIASKETCEHMLIIIHEIIYLSITMAVFCRITTFQYPPFNIIFILSKILLIHHIYSTQNIYVYLITRSTRQLLTSGKM